MKPKSGSESNSTNRNNLENEQAIESSSLKNLVDLLNEFTFDEEMAATDIDFVKQQDNFALQNSDRLSSIEKLAKKSEKSVSPHTKTIEPSSNKAKAERKPVNKQNSFLAKTSNGSSDKKTVKPEQIVTSETRSVKSENISDSSPQKPQIKYDSVDAEDIAKTYISQQWIREKEKQIKELAQSVDTLIPLIVELSKSQTDDSEEYILKAIVPIIDRVIQQRSVEDNQKMAAAIADILPDAIRQEITKAPESIGKAIAPEIALSIKEQIKLNEGAVARAMGSEMGQAIKNQIEMERDAMVDALYPVIGSTISKYMAEVVESINDKIDSALSPQGIQRKIKAKLQGVSEAELILKESLPYSVRAIFLIHKTSGLIIQELQPHSENSLESDLLAGMLTAIRNFASDCITSDSELDEIDYDSFKILFETAGYCYLAVVINGEPDRQFRDRMRTIFSQVVLKYSDVIENYQGDPKTVPRSIQPLLEELTVREVLKHNHTHSKALYWLIALILGLIFIPFGIIRHRGQIANRIEQAVAVELDATPELSVYRLIPEVKKGQLTLTGRVPSSYFRNLAASVTQQIATAEDLELENKIVAVNVPVDPTATTQEIARLTELFNQKSPSTIATEYSNHTLTIDGLILDPEEQQIIVNTFANIPGVDNVVFLVKQELPQLKTSIYFASGSSEFDVTTDSVKISQVKKFLERYPAIKLKIIGHSDRRGRKETNLQLARERANSVYQALIARDVDPQRLKIAVSLKSPPDLSPDAPLWLSRRVRFESFIAEKK